MLNIYLASGWFSENTDRSLTELENLLKSTEYISPYFPRHDGIKLSANEFHDHKLRKSIFNENVSQIRNSDYLLVNLDGSDGYYDTGTCWELGYAMSMNIPVIAYDPTDTLEKRFSGIKAGFKYSCKSISEVKSVLKEIVEEHLQKDRLPKKLLFVSPNTTDEQKSNTEDILASVILESHGVNFKWVDTTHSGLQGINLDNMFSDVDYMIAVIDDRDPVVSWMMGQAHERGVPIVSFTNYDYGVNIMLSVSILAHCKGKEELKTMIQKIKREGLSGFSEYDTSALRAY